MTTLIPSGDVLITEDIDLEDIDTATGHLKCCERERFLCDTPYDPEFVVEAPDEACSVCNGVHLIMSGCGQRSGQPHQHCPFERKVCRP